ncbi:hypothetical protein CDD81_1319 [Ophiocordyceps australis]|uniref:C2H2-type domain-containing protein n=1 Tax=Ophiocordyceps australis TaxID=1399860 RepID=A0A2C5Y1E5_9HYPO|nr:hypothetical protein CDD81_1319 [Ophiocordyceps australis]
MAPISERFRGHHQVPLSRSHAISIPGLEPRTQAPPPLPPPRIVPIGDAPQLPEDMSREHRDYGHGPASMASGYGSIASSFADDRPNYRKRESGSLHDDEGYASYASTERSRDSVTPDLRCHHKTFSFQSYADLQADNFKRMMVSTRTNNSPAGEISRRHETRLPSLSMQTQLPMHHRPQLDSPGRLADGIYSAVSPQSATPFHRSPIDHRPYSDTMDIERSPLGRTRRNDSDDTTSARGSCDLTAADDMEIEGTSSLRRLRIDDAYATGQKRRAASPPPEELQMQQHCVSGPSDLVRRRDVGSRGSPTPRLATFPTASSVSAMPPAAVSRSSSYMSTVSSVTPASSFGRRSPGGVSPGGISPTSCNSPYATPVSLTHSPRTSISARPPVHARNTSGTSPRKVIDVQKPSASVKPQGFLMCECCPKKPKKFETEEDLRAHKAEKQYECSFCGNRFKNKNEAERHQNSLHVRSHSWSCSALSGYHRAFHDSPNKPGEADTCGYCGSDFARSGQGPVSRAVIVPKHATNDDWDERIRHLQEEHKFGECNSAKKFYRADHFRQHLKHSHAGKSGKWTNMLENACMMEEMPPPR